MNNRQVSKGDRHYLFNDDSGLWDETLFDGTAEAGGDRDNRRGRGSVSFFCCNGVSLVRKQYRRGGLFGRIIKKSYFYTSLENTRMWQEFYLLRFMESVDLPVPRIIAANCERRLLLSYRGQLVTEEIPQSVTLAQHLEAHPLTSTQWREVGITIRKFHDLSIYHADLNANNILIDANSRVWLIDFDKSRVREQRAKQWKRDNLNRFLRSLKKLRTNTIIFNFNDSDWENFVRGYEGSLSEPF